MNKYQREITIPTNKIVPIDLIKPHPDNYNQHPEEQIKQLERSYSELGQFRSIVLWEQSDGTFIQLAGHGIVEAMQRENVSEVRADVHPPSLDPMIAKRILLADNLHAKNSVPDDTLLAQLLQEQYDAGYDLASLGSDEESLRQMLQELGDEAIANGSSKEREAPEEFESYGEDIETQYCCPKCGYNWSGKPK